MKEEKKTDKSVEKEQSTKQSFFFPEYQMTIEAKDLGEATEILNKKLNK